MGVGIGSSAGPEPLGYDPGERACRLRESALRFRDLVRRGSDGAVVLDQSGRVRFMSPAAMALLGPRSGELMGKDLGVAVLAGDLVEVEVVQEGDVPSVVEMRIVPTEWEGEPAHLAFLRDVTDARSSEGARSQYRVAVALARAGAELNESLDAPTILSRLSRLAVELLGGGTAMVYLWSPARHRFVRAALHGAEGREPADALGPGGGVAEVRGCLAGAELVWIEPGGPAPALLRDLALLTGFARMVAVPLRCEAGAVEGFLAVGDVSASDKSILPERLHGAESPQERITRGLAQMASVALENAHALEDMGRQSEARAELLSVLSHELRSAVHVILGYDELLLDGDFGKLNRQQSETVRRIGRSARHLSDVIENTLSLSRIEACSLPVALEGVSVTDLLSQLEAETSALWRCDGLRFRWRNGADLPQIQTDPQKVRLIVRNLLDNAVKFTGEGEVRVSARRLAGGVEISIADTGPGIPAERRAEIFDRFRQGDQPVRQGRSGVGLGLYIVRRMLDLLGGTIRLESRVGRGSTFRVWLPESPSSAASAVMPSNPTRPAARRRRRRRQTAAARKRTHAPPRSRPHTARHGRRTAAPQAQVAAKKARSRGAG